MNGPPRDGPNPAKAKFFSEVAAAFELLAIFYQLPREAQEDLWQAALILQSGGSMRGKPKKEREQ